MNTSVEFGSALKSANAEAQGQSQACFENKAKLESPALDATLPEEILEKIFLNLDDSKDVQAVCNATPQFRRIVKPSMPVWAIDQIFPLVFSQLDKQDILQCRLVCKKWTSSVDRYIQSHPQNRGMMPYPPPKQSSRNHPAYRPECHPNLCSKDLFGNVFLNMDQMEKKSEKMQTATGNPFVTRSVCFSNLHEDEEIYWHYALTFLEKHGEHIWHAVVGPEGNCALFNYQVLHNALRLMPNVRTLVLYGFEGGHCGVGNRFRRYIRQHPLPNLAHLHTIDEMLPESRVGKLVVNEMLERYSGQLGSLITSVRRGNPPQWSALTQMTALKLNNYCDSYQFWGQLLGSSSAPHVAKLSLTVCVTQTVSISKLLKPLQKAFPSLVYLQIWFASYSRIHKCSRPPTFLMESVKTLEVNDHPNLQFNRLLSFFPALEYVLVCHQPDVPIFCDVDDEREMEIRMRMRFRSMYKSDIWTRIKTLKEFTLAKYGDTGDTENEAIVERQFTREGYGFYVGDNL